MQLYLIIILTLAAALIASFSQFLFKKSLHGAKSLKKVIRAVFTPRVLAGFCGYLLALVLYLYALSQADLSIVYPVFASSFIFTTIISAVLLRERITVYRAAGVLLIFIGIAVIAVSA